jgi:hypothetical protein
MEEKYRVALYSEDRMFEFCIPSLSLDNGPKLQENIKRNRDNEKWQESFSGSF